MAVKKKPEVVWERAEPAKRPAPEPLSRERIVRAAIALADAEGLDAVSLRKVGAALDAGPMRLYGHLATKDELLDLMIDAVYGEMAAPSPSERSRLPIWRRTLRGMAHRLRAAAAAHPWLVDLLGGRPHLGPNALAQLEAWLAAVSAAPGFEDVDDAMQAVSTVYAYALGAIRAEASDLASGLDEKAWQAASMPYLERLLASGRFPVLARIMREAKHPSADVVFECGLECVLDGIAARYVR
ncbi:MAG: TetR/AcrR family transcriptional regulator C-terminal domain-containing protein [Myxococcota bacterium]